MPRKRKELNPGEAMPLSLKLDPELSTRVDALVTELARSTGLTVVRSDVVRMLLREALDARDSRTKSKR